MDARYGQPFGTPLNLNQNMGIVHQVCHTYFRRDAMQREDVFQDIMYQLWKSYPQFKQESKFSTWMYKVALNTAITHIRRSTRAPRNAELTQSVGCVPHNQHLRLEEVRLLHEAIAALTDIDSQKAEEKRKIAGGGNPGHSSRSFIWDRPGAALRDPILYELPALVDAIRNGRARERKIAEKQPKSRLGTDPG